MDSKDEMTEQMYNGYIFGHGLSSVDIELDNCDEYEKQDLKETIESFAKDIQTDLLNEFITRQYDISDIVVLGHSLGLVDKPYFEILNNNLPQTHWQIGCFDDNDLYRKIHNCRKIGIDSSNIVFFKDN